tara:strand:+ start:2076 stop:2489 length:414 start_codon:yes stop_codon:yes gene_type:complete
MDFDNYTNVDSTINWRESMFGFAKDDEYDIFCDLCNAVSAIRNIDIKDVLSVHDMEKRTLYMENAAHSKDPTLRILNFMHNNGVDFHGRDKNGNSILYYIDQNKEPIMKQLLLNFISKNTLYTGEKLDSSIYKNLKV